MNILTRSFQWRFVTLFFIISLFITLFLTACATSPVTSPVNAPINAPVNAHTDNKNYSEELLAQPPPDWNLIYQLNNISSRISEFVPPGESVSAWSTKLSFESFLELTAMDPIQVLLAEVQQDKERCDFVQHFNLFSGLENSYPSSVRLFLCGKNQDENGEVKMIKAIQGNDYLYVVTILKKIDSFEPNQAQFEEEEIATWSTYLRGISLCDNQDTSHNCPATNVD